MIPALLAERLERDFGALGAARTLAEGPAASTLRVATAQGDVVLKWARGGAPYALVAEAVGLRALATARDASGADLVIPEVLKASEPEGAVPAHLVLEALEPSGRLTSAHGERLGTALAQIHAEAAPGAGYGFGRTTYLGGTPQPNGPLESWPAFFRDRRLEPLAERVRQAGRWEQAWTGPWSRLLKGLDALLPERPHAALVHGDLWSGNALGLADGRVALIDPAVYRGHAEVDLAMTRLFGGFPACFYRAYEAVVPSEPGREERADVYNLLHGLNHVALFGSGYAGMVARLLSRY